jgi:hypothetical protein
MPLNINLISQIAVRVKLNCNSNVIWLKYINSGKISVQMLWNSSLKLSTILSNRPKLFSRQNSCFVPHGVILHKIIYFVHIFGIAIKLCFFWSAIWPHRSNFEKFLYWCHITKFDPWCCSSKNFKTFGEKIKDIHRLCNIVQFSRKLHNCSEI